MQNLSQYLLDGKITEDGKAICVSGADKATISINEKLILLWLRRRR